MPDGPDPSTQPLRASAGWLLGERYRVLDRLGTGGMAEVFRAHDELLDRDVAVKVFRRAALDDPDTQGELRRELELQTLAHLSHPNLITLFDASLSGDPAYLVLELVQGPDLATRLRHGPLPEPEARQIGAQIADALSYVHACGMVHRDVKPANILLGDDGVPGVVRARLSDFGIVRMVGSARMTAADLTLGTASYVAPEQARGGNVGPAADVYALGLMLIEALTGVRCFDGPIHEALAARVTTTPQVPSGLPEPWPGLLAAMTALDPTVRPPASVVADALRGTAPAPIVSPTAATLAAAPLMAAAGATRALSTPPAPVGAVRHADRRRVRGTALVLAALAFAAILAGAGVLLSNYAGGPSSGTTQAPPSQHGTPSHPASHTSAHVTQAAERSTTHHATHAMPPPASKPKPKPPHQPPGHTKGGKSNKPKASGTTSSTASSTSPPPTAAGSGAAGLPAGP